MARRIEYYRTADGRCPVEEFLDGLAPQDERKVFFVLKLIEELQRVPAEYFKKLAGTEDIWECRIRSGTNAYRVFSFFFRGDTLVLTHGYQKKSQKTDLRQIRRAEQYRRDYLSRRSRR
ncbi:MAG TPA: type II toxin-antitoxin system RelE/ParE family toxin [Pirellulales bacterium]|nr:type II toxin-antitoxin system RelE/ParE family toxin [Pirellulales bacterium]